ncbi:glutathione S-transferase [Penicillium argentinense]|uniref:Glutathione S-transferase n=1 Tax=Penicillium argentinense TaxID=1131581 RepID=A0A9W9KBC3_9EURO|nr:glutathione S-transferase [Penicillium argentinense]KAJ5100020.1 glutathione S-transferase [Penicillium argentinense]
MNDHTDLKESIHLYTKKGSSNGVETIMLLEELELPYYLCSVNHIEEIPDKRFDFADIHNYLPILTDFHPNGQRFRVQESGAIAQYLIARYDKGHKLSYPTSSSQHTEVNNWLFFLASRLGPNHREAAHFLKAPVEVSYGISRFTNKTIQLYFATERHLQNSQMPYIVGNICTIVDFLYFPYVAEAKSAGIDIDEFPALNSWYKNMLQRPAIAEFTFTSHVLLPKDLSENHMHVGLLGRLELPSRRHSVVTEDVSGLCHMYTEYAVQAASSNFGNMP